MYNSPVTPPRSRKTSAISPRTPRTPSNRSKPFLGHAQFPGNAECFTLRRLSDTVEVRRVCTQRMIEKLLQVGSMESDMMFNVAAAAASLYTNATLQMDVFDKIVATGPFSRKYVSGQRGLHIFYEPDLDTNSIFQYSSSPLQSSLSPSAHARSGYDHVSKNPSSSLLPPVTIMSGYSQRHSPLNFRPNSSPRSPRYSPLPATPRRTAKSHRDRLLPPLHQALFDRITNQSSCTFEQLIDEIPTWSPIWTRADVAKALSEGPFVMSRDGTMSLKSDT